MLFSLKNSEHPLVIFSSFAYCLVGIFLFVDINYSFDIPFLLSFVGIAAFLHHAFPGTNLFRVLDWVGAVVLAFVLLTVDNVSRVEVGLFVVALFTWLMSLYYFHTKRSLRNYTLYHSIWHLLSSFVAFIILK